MLVKIWSREFAPLVGKSIMGFRWKDFAADVKSSLLKSPAKIVALFGYFDSAVIKEDL